MAAPAELRAGLPAGEEERKYCKQHSTPGSDPRDQGPPETRDPRRPGTPGDQGPQETRDPQRPGTPGDQGPPETRDPRRPGAPGDQGPQETRGPRRPGTRSEGAAGEYWRMQWEEGKRKPGAGRMKEPYKLDTISPASPTGQTRQAAGTQPLGHPAEATQTRCALLSQDRTREINPTQNLS